MAVSQEQDPEQKGNRVTPVPFSIGWFPISTIIGYHRKQKKAIGKKPGKQRVQALFIA